MGIRTIALLEKANELGFDSIEEAIDAGYEIAYTGNPELAHFYKPTNNSKGE